jgi:hypothetical protein
MNNALAGHATRQTNALSLAQAITERRFGAGDNCAGVQGDRAQIILLWALLLAVRRCLDGLPAVIG